MEDAAEGSVEEVALAAVPEGTRVLGVDGGKLGEVVAVYRDRLIVERGFFFPTDFYVPFAAVGEHAGGTIRLIVSLREALEFGWEAPPVDDPLPIAAAEVPAGGPTPSAAEPAPTVVEPATSTAPTPGEPVSPRVPVRPPAVAEPPLPAPPAGETSAEAPPLATAPAASHPTVPETVELDPKTEHSMPAEPTVSVDVVAPPLAPTPTADRPTPASPVVGAAGSSYLSRLFPDLVGQTAGSPLSAEPVPPASAAVATSQPDLGASAEPTVAADPPPTEPAPVGLGPADAVEASDDPAPANDAAGDEPQAQGNGIEERPGEPAKE